MKQLSLFYDQDREQLLTDLFTAYFDARRNKRNTINALSFEINYEHNLIKLADEIINFNYKIKPSLCFINFKPVQREIFAGDFRDRIVHHLIYNYIAPIFEKTFINDSYSCRKKKGTHYGIKRINHFIRSCSDNYHSDCYILKLDIHGYFMSIDRIILFDKVNNWLCQQQQKLSFDLPLVLYLVKKVVFNDPTKDCILKGNKNDWQGLPASKSLFCSGPNKGLPIGNLTSQLFANIYLNELDHFVKRKLKISYYGRYVDDMVLIHPSKDYLKTCIPIIRSFLDDNLKLSLHPKKVYLQHFSKGVRFLGVIIKPYRMYISNRTKNNFYHAIQLQNVLIKNHVPSKNEQRLFLSSMNSYLGILRHFNTYRLKEKMIHQVLSKQWLRRVIVSSGLTKFTLNVLSPFQKGTS